MMAQSHLVLLVTEGARPPDEIGAAIELNISRHPRRTRHELLWVAHWTGP